MGATRSAAESRSGEGTPRTEPHLYLVIDVEHPDRAEPIRIALGDLDEIAIGRGDAREVSRRGRKLSIKLPDEFMSTKHARFVRVLDKWSIEDEGSKNGTLVDGQVLERRILADGDWIELGRTFFYFREAVFPADVASDPDFATQDPDLLADLADLSVIAASTISIVIGGEVGTGKEVVAKSVHRRSKRSGDYVVVNCGALPANLVESELFGYRKGAFSGALEDRVGLVRSADRGTLVLDEIGELPMPAQATLLRVLQESEVMPVGATRPIAVDLRVIAATNRDLSAMVAAGTFRADLYSRIAGFTIELPPLRDRFEDLGMLVAKLLPAKHAIAPKAMRQLVRHAWPGNIRELEKTLETASVLARNGSIALEHLPETIRNTTRVSSTNENVPDRATLESILRDHKGNVSAVARELGKAPMQVRRWMKRYALEPDTFR